MFVKIIDPLKFWIRSIPGKFLLAGSTLTTISHMFTQRVDTTIKSNIMDHMDNMVSWESASMSSPKGNASGKLLLFYGVKAFLGIREVSGTGSLDFQKILDKVQQKNLLKHHQ